MIINKDTPDNSGRDIYAFYLLESSGYVDPWKSEIGVSISEGAPDDIEVIIKDLLLNQEDRWSSFTDKSIIRRINRKFM